MPLLFAPHREAMFSWGDVAPPLADLRAEPGRVALVVPPGERRTIGGTFRSLGESVAALAAVPIADLDAIAPSVTAFCLASKLALDLVARERVVPWADAGRARWAVALSADDHAQVATLAAAWPRAAHACCTDLSARPAPARALDVWEPEALVRAFLDSAADALVRSAGRALPAPLATTNGPWERRWIKALSAADATFEPSGFGERTLARDLQRWSRPARGARDEPSTCFRLELPTADEEAFVVRILLQAPDDPSLLVTAEDVWRGKKLEKLGRAFRDPEEALLAGLGGAARLVPVLRAGRRVRPRPLPALRAARAHARGGARGDARRPRRLSCGRCRGHARGEARARARRRLRRVARTAPDLEALVRGAGAARRGGRRARQARIMAREGDPRRAARADHAVCIDPGARDRAWDDRGRK